MVYTKPKLALASCVHIDVHQHVTNQFNRTDSYITDDSLGKVNFNFPTLKGYKDFPLFPYIHKSSASKNFSLYNAYQNKDIDWVVILDSDCIIENIDFFEDHLPKWQNPLHSDAWFPRGYPYSERNIVANMGLWTNVLDINGKDRLGDHPKSDILPQGKYVAKGFIPLSGMNLCIKREALPCLFFLPNFSDFRRHDDIWGGYIFQKFLKKRGDKLTYGEPFIRHETVVDADADAREEEPMNTHDNEFYSLVDKAFEHVHIRPYNEMLQEFNEEVFRYTRFEELIEPFKIWKSLHTSLSH